MKMTVIVTYRNGKKKGKQMQFARIVDMSVTPERGDFITFVRHDAEHVIDQSPVLATVHDRVDDRERPQRFRVTDRELFTAEQPGFGEAVIYVKPGNRAAQSINVYVADNGGTGLDMEPPEEHVSRWMMNHGLVPLPCLKELGANKKWRTKTPNGRDHYEIAREYLGDKVPA